MKKRIILPMWAALAVLVVLVGGGGVIAAGVDPAVLREAGLLDRGALRRALDDLAGVVPERFADLEALRAKVAVLPDGAGMVARLQAGEAGAEEEAVAALALRRRILLANPLLDFDRVVCRVTDKPGLPANFHSNSSIARTGYDNAIVEFSIRGGVADRVVLRPEGGRFVGDLCLHFDAGRMLFSMPAERDWQVFEVNLDGSGLRQVSPVVREGIGNYDACYLPNGDYLYTSTLPMVSVPCVAGDAHVANLVRLSPDGTLRQLCFDQEHNWCPRVLADGTVLYQRWEYTDTPHANTRLLMTMNPDGSNQKAFYGSNSYWPAAFFYATPVPGSSTRVAGISGGHHGDPRLGELYVLDVSRGRTEDAGVVAQIPSHPATPSGKGRIYDHMRDVWPRFLHPQPLSDKYFLCACQPTPGHPWGAYLVDVFDNLLPLREVAGRLVLEPVPVVRRPVPPVIPDKVDPARKDAVVYVQDIHEGPGLKGIPRGAVKSLRVFSYTFSYHNVGGLYGVLGQDGPWDIHRPLGTVAVLDDGSAKFKVPANTPLAIQPLDGDGQALAQMRSWFTAMPGEVLSCVGCHESANSTPPARATLAFTAPAAEIVPRRVPVTGFGFEREVQPVLDRHCVGCHDGGRAVPDFRGGTMVRDWSSAISGNGGAHAGKFSTSYVNLLPYTRANGIEGDYRLLAPMEFHFSTSELGQMLRKGHHGVELDADARERLVTWVDLNRPYHGSWSSVQWGDAVALEADRAAMREAFAGVVENHEEPLPPVEPVVAVSRQAVPPVLQDVPRVEGWPFDGGAARRMQGDWQREILDEGGVGIPLVRIPAGAFVMGSATGHRDEQPLAPVRIEKPFWMGVFEITNRQYRMFDPGHDSRVADALNYQFGQRPWSINGDGQPVCRVSWREAQDFCRWLSVRTGRRVRLPDEAQWEWAARAGTATAFPAGGLDVDTGRVGNMADVSMRRFAACTAADNYHAIRIVADPVRYDLPLLHDPRVDDGVQLSCAPGGYAANAFGLHDMHGNVAEWTRSRYAAYPYDGADGRNDEAAAGERVVRGGGWWNRPFQCSSSHRAVFQEYQPVMWVGFRVVVEEG